MIFSPGFKSQIPYLFVKRAPFLWIPQFSMVFESQKTRSFVKKAPFLWISRARHLADPNLKRLLKVKYAHKCKRGGGVEKLPRRESRNEINGACGGDEGNITTSWI